MLGKRGPKPGANYGPRGKDTPEKKAHREYVQRYAARKRREEARKKKEGKK